MLGDNHADSEDSRHRGPIPVKYVYTKNIRCLAIDGWGELDHSERPWEESGVLKRVDDMVRRAPEGPEASKSYHSRKRKPQTLPKKNIQNQHSLHQRPQEVLYGRNGFSV